MKIKINEIYRLRSQPNYCYAKPIELLKAKQGVNIHNYQVLKCEWSIDRDFKYPLIKYFRPCDLN